MLGVLADDAAHDLPLAIAAQHQTAVFADRFAGRSDFHGRDSRNAGRGRGCCLPLAGHGPRRHRREAVDDAPLFEIVRGHLNLHAVSGQDAHPMDAHAPCQMAEELVVLCLVACHADAERGIGKGFFHNADEFNNILGHRQIAGSRESRTILQTKTLGSKPGTWQLWVGWEKCIDKFKICYLITYFGDAVRELHNG